MAEPKVTLRKIPDHWSGRNAYEIHLDGVEIGIVRASTAPKGYWGSWEGRGPGGRVISDSRGSVVRQIVAAAQR